jgi:FAD/FMN-containing dehydrogenase
MIGTSWGRWPRYQHTVVPLNSRFEPLPASSTPLLPFGNGRSYGDVCLNANGTLVSTRGLDRWIGFDPATGILECEAGVLLSDIIDLMLPRGWYPAVCPGTAFVSIGGAIANDVHGKNHHRLGSFGHHLLGFELLRSDGETLTCTPEQNADWFRATIGGLGLTGLIRTARLRLRPVTSPWIKGDSQRFSNLAEFFQLSTTSESQYEYSVAWLDCAASGRKLGRGVFIRGDHAPGSELIGQANIADKPATMLRVPLTPPISPVFGVSVRIFNTLYFHRPAAQRAGMRWKIQQFNFPLDSVSNWNRLYGPRGFFQYQCVLPEQDSHGALTEMLQRIARARQGSFLSVLKKFGTMPSLGMMSFPRPGVTLALDFPNRGASTLQLLDSLDEITRQAKGAVYPAKDARMSASSFQQYYPAWNEFRRYIDPHFSSSFWRRVTE